MTPLVSLRDVNPVYREASWSNDKNSYIMNFFLYGVVIFLIHNQSSCHSHETDGFQSTLGHLKPKVAPTVQADAVQHLIKRIIGEKSEWFLIVIDPTIGVKGKDTFQISTTAENKIEIIGTSGVAAAWGFHYYLKNYCNCHISWDGNQIELPEMLPRAYAKITSNDRFRYYQNVCMAGYSTVWWQWDQWEKHIDWMALNGINLVLAFNGQEAIWERVYSEFNFTTNEIDEHFGGPAFLPWSRMGNIRGWGGPLSSSWHDNMIKLQHKILDRMRQIGIIPVLPSFAGYVPRAFKRIFPFANLHKIGAWNNFEDKYCCPYLLSPLDPLFKVIGKKFLQMYINEFGTDHVYNCDVFNENEPPISNLDFLKSTSTAIYTVMTEIDPQAIWIIQGWFFVNDFDFWTEHRVKAFITAVPIGKMIILDLQSEQFPQYERLHSYYGQPFIWCMLHNFGGTLGMFGSATIINKRVIEARKMNGSTMVGIGLTPEGINQNYVIYELMMEMGYRGESVDLDAWFESYSVRRYGSWNKNASKAWQILGQTIYNFIDLERIRGHYVITKRPSLKIQFWTWYPPKSILNVWTNMVEARFSRAKNTLYKHDLVDITRQSLQVIGEDIYLSIKDAFNKKNLIKLKNQTTLLLELFDDMEKILAASEHFLFGKWINNARLLGTNDEEKNLYEYNARNQITLWGPDGQIRDYANKQWSSVMEDYFKARWALFLDTLVNSTASGTAFNSDVMDKRIFEEVEKPFTYSKKKYPVAPRGDAVRIAVSLNEIWGHYNMTFISVKFMNNNSRKYFDGE